MPRNLDNVFVIRRTDYLLNGNEPQNNHLRERLIAITRELEMVAQDIPA